MGPVFALAPAYRTGSTLLQRILNTCSNLTIWGENGDLVGHLVSALSGLRHQAESGGDSERIQFSAGSRNILSSHMIPERELIISSFRSLLMTLYSRPGVRWGFKEVRCGRECVALLDELFPDARYLFLVRDPFETFISYANVGWIEESLVQLAAAWPIRVGFFLEYAKAHPDRAKLVRYEDLSISTSRDIFEFIEECFHGDRVEEVLRSRWGGSKKLRPLTERERDTIRSHVKPLATKLYPSG